MKIVIENTEIEFNSLLFDKNKKLYDIKKIIVKRDYFLKNCNICNKQFKVHYNNLDKEICSSCQRSKTNMERYGRSSSFNLEKSKKTKLKKYGNENYNNRDKFKETSIERFNSQHPSQSQQIRDKIKQNLNYDKSVANKKRKATKKLRYNNENFNNLEQIRSTNLMKFNREWGFEYEKSKTTSIEKYGTEFPNQSEEIKQKLKLKSLSKSYNLFSNRLKNLVTPLFSLEEYLEKANRYQEFSWKCNKCNTQFNYYLSNGIIPRCPKCFPLLRTTSNMEKELNEWIISLGIETIENTRKIISPKELDIYIPSHNLAIEFDGLYFHGEIGGQKDSKYHLNKTKMCQEKGIQLLHIFEDEWIEKQNIVKSIIKSKLGIYDVTLHGRKCTINKISSKEANNFYNENHIQGSCLSSINLGLFHENEFVSCLSFSKSRFNKKYDWEITRFANKLNTKIHGAFSKLWKQRPKGSIITYSDKRLF